MTAMNVGCTDHHNCTISIQLNILSHRKHWFGHWLPTPTSLQSRGSGLYLGLCVCFSAQYFRNACS